MDIAIIGAGNVGGALARSFARAGHSVTVTATSAERADQLARETGAHAVGTNLEAVAAGEAVVLAVPTSALDGLLEEIGGAVGGKIVIDVTNRVNLEDPGAVLDGSSNAERIQAVLPEARVVKAFNTAFASRQADPVVDGTPIDGFIAADDDGARKEVLDLVASIGFRPIDVGPLVMARALEAMAVVIVSLQVRHGWSWSNGWKLVGPTG
jgi:8-hydroxy-5-deazaflavin:NADPH oxidoreductase